MRVLRAQWLKTKGTSLRLMVLGLPLLYGSLSALYLSSSPLAPSQVEKMAYFFQLLAILALFFASIIIYLVVELDKQVQSFYQEMRPDYPRWQTVSGKYLLVCLLVLWLYGLSFGVYYIVQSSLQGQLIPLLPGLKLVGVSFIFFLPVIAFYLFSSYRFSFNATMVSSGLLTIAGIILGTTNLGDRLWVVFPPAWGLRFISFKTALFFDDQVDFLPSVVIFSIIALLLFFGGFLCHIIWYNQWEGTKSE